jgi:1,4-dihydroxy-6-naphthoate synthase
VLRQSIDHGLDHRKDALDHAMKYARGLDRKRADAFVGMYVNDWTRELGPRGRKAVELFLGEAVTKGLVPPVRIEYQER